LFQSPFPAQGSVTQFKFDTSSLPFIALPSKDKLTQYHICNLVKLYRTVSLQIRHTGMDPTLVKAYRVYLNMRKYFFLLIHLKNGDWERGHVTITQEVKHVLY